MTLPGHSVLPSLAVLFLGACAGERWVERLPRAPREMPLRVAARDLGPLFRPPADWPDAFLARGCGLGDDGTAAFTKAGQGQTVGPQWKVPSPNTAAKPDVRTPAEEAG